MQSTIKDVFAKHVTRKKKVLRYKGASMKKFYFLLFFMGIGKINITNKFNLDLFRQIGLVTGSF